MIQEMENLCNEPVYIGTLGKLFCIVCFYIKGYRFVTIKMTIISIQVFVFAYLSGNMLFG